MLSERNFMGGLLMSLIKIIPSEYQRDDVDFTWDVVRKSDGLLLGTLERNTNICPGEEMFFVSDRDCTLTKGEEGSVEVFDTFAEAEKAAEDLIDKYYDIVLH